jgi:hypothetical protein
MCLPPLFAEFCSSLHVALAMMAAALGVAFFLLMSGPDEQAPAEE